MQACNNLNSKDKEERRRERILIFLQANKKN